MKMVLGLTETLPALVERRFAAAKESGSLVFSATHLTTIQASGVAVSRTCVRASRGYG